MNVLLAGGTGFIGRHLASSLLSDGNQVFILSRQTGQVFPGLKTVLWDGQTLGDWSRLINEMDAVVNLSGLSLSNWPWNRKKKQQFLDSRVMPGLALSAAIANAEQRPAVFLQISGVNHYGLRGDGIADENTPPASDYLAQLTIAWEDSTRSVENLGVRRVTCRTAVVLARDAQLVKLMTLPARLFFGGPLGSGDQALPWIHIDDQIGAIRYLLAKPEAKGAYNMIAPQPTSNAEFMRTVAKTLRKPYWFPVPANLMQLGLGEMSALVTEGRFVTPKRLLDQGYIFRFPTLGEALEDILRS